MKQSTQPTQAQPRHFAAQEGSRVVGAEYGAAAGRVPDELALDELSMDPSRDGPELDTDEYEEAVAELEEFLAGPAKTGASPESGPLLSDTGSVDGADSFPPPAGETSGDLLWEVEASDYGLFDNTGGFFGSAGAGFGANLGGFLGFLGGASAVGGIALAAGGGGGGGRSSTNTIDTLAPTVTDPNIAISGGSGANGEYIIGDAVTVTWDNSATGDNNTDTIGNMTVDFSAFGGETAAVANGTGGIWIAAHTIVDSMDTTGLDVSVTATDDVGNSTTTADTTGASVDTIAPTVTDDNIAISGASGAAGEYIIDDTITVTWDNSAAGDDNADTISEVTVDFSAFGGGSAVAATDTSGIWTASYDIVAGNIHDTGRNVSVTAIDDAGNRTETADGTETTVDNIVPTLGSIVIASDNTDSAQATTGDRITVSFAASESLAGNPTATILGQSATVANTTGNSYTASYTVAGTETQGAATFAIDFTDAAGNPGAQVTAVTDASSVTVDYTPPTIAITSTPLIEGDGVVNADEDDTVLVSGTTNAEEGQTVTVRFTDSNEATVSATATVPIDGIWTLAGSEADISGLAEGTITVTAEVADAAGNSADPASTTITYDRTAPTITITTPIEGDDLVSGGEAGDVLIEGTTDAADGRTVTVTFTDSASATVTAQATVASGAWGLTTDISSGLTEGTITVTAEVADAAGNSGQALPATITYNPNAPSIAIDPSIEGDDVVNDTEDDHVLVSGTTDAGDGRTVTVTFSDGVNADVPATATVTGATWTLASSEADISSLAEGLITVTAEVSKVVGTDTYSAQVSTTITHDTTATITITTPIEGDDTVSAGEDNDVLVEGTTDAEDGQTVTVTFTDSATPVATMTATATVAGGAWSLAGSEVDISSTLAVGTITVTAEVEDAAGNSAQASTTITYDPNVPTLVITTPIEGDDVVNASEDDHVLVSGTADADTPSVAVTFSDGDANTTADVTATAPISGGAWTLTGSEANISSLNEGPITVTANVANTGGYSAELSTTITYDATAPTLDIASDVSAVNAGETAAITFTFSETPVDFAAGDITTTGGALTDLAPDGSDDKVYTATFTPDADSEGSASITVALGDYTDAAGNDGGAGTTPTITIDTLAPTLSSVVIASDNTDTTRASTGDTITVSFTASEALVGDPTVTILGQSAEVTDNGSDNYTAAYTVAGAEIQGAVTFSIDGFADAAGNAGEQVSAVTDTSGVIVDYTAPRIMSIAIDAIEDDGVVNEQESMAVLVSGITDAEEGQTVTVTFTDSATPAATVTGTATVASNGTWALAGSEIADISTFTVGDVTVSADVMDAAGNNADQVSQVIEYNPDYVAVGITAGTFITASDLTVRVYNPAGNLLGSSRNKNAYGKYIVDFDNYTGPLLISVVDNDDATPDYVDEATGAAVNLGTPLRAMTVADGGFIGATVSPLTELATRKAGVPDDPTELTEATFTEESVTATNTQIATLFGITSSNLVETTVVPVTEEGYETQDAAGQQYAEALALMSGAADVADGDTGNDGVDMDAMLTTFDEGLVEGEGGAFEPTTNTTTSGFSATDLLIGGIQAFEVGDNADEADLTTIVESVLDDPIIVSVNPSWGKGLGAAEIGSNGEITVTTLNVEDEQTVTVTFDGVDYRGTVSGNTATMAIPASILGGLPDGSSYTLIANVSNSEGTAADTHDLTRFTVDMSPPALTSAAIASGNSDDTLARTGDAITVSFTANEELDLDATTVDILGESATVSRAATYNETSGNYDYTAIYTVAGAETQGAATFAIDFADVAGNAGAQVTAVTDTSSVTVDYTPPTLSITTPIEGDGIVSGVEDGHALVSGTTDAEDGQSVTVTFRDGVNANVTAQAPVAGSLWTLTGSEADISGLDEGAIMVTADVDDQAGNSATQASAGITHDTTAPTISSVGIASDNANNTLAATGNTITLTFTANEALAGDPTVTILGRSATVTNTAGNSYTATYTVVDGDTEGAATFAIDFTDAAGNPGDTVSAADTGSVTVDTMPPAITSVTADWQADTYLNAAEDDSDGTVTVAATGADGQEVTITLNGNDYTGDLASGTVDIAVAAADLQALTDGNSYQIAANVSDVAGNAATEVSSASFTVDTTAPTLDSLTSDTVDGTYGPGSSIDLIAAYDEAPATGSTITVSLDNGASVTLDTISGNTLTGTYTVGATGSGEDSGDLTVSAITSQSTTDASGNTQSGTTLPGTNVAAGSALVIDTTAPTLDSLTSDTVDGIYGPGSSINLIAAYDEAPATGSTITVSLDNGASVTLDTISGNTLTGTYTVGATGSGEDSGDLTVSAITSQSAVDASGNTQSGTTLPGTNVAAGSALVIDTTAPTLDSLTSDTVDGIYGPGSSINLIAAYDEAPATGSTITVSLDNGASVTLDTISGNTLTGTYTVGATGSGEDSGDLTVSAITSQSTLDAAGNTQSGTTLPGTNVAAGSALVIDTTAPTLSNVTIASDNTTYDTVATPGDTVTLTFTASEALIGDPTVTLLFGGDATTGTAVAVSTSDTDASDGVDYTATYDVVDTDTEGAATFSVDFTDAAGNPGAQVTEANITDGSGVTVDMPVLHTFHGDGAGDAFGWSVSGAGDADGDGYGDMVVGAYGDDNNGLADSGSARLFSGQNGAVLDTFDGGAAGDRFGYVVSMGDRNSDGYNDVVVSAYRDNSGAADSGSVRSFSGQDYTEELSAIDGPAALGLVDRFGGMSPLSSTPYRDVNGDGTDDAIVGENADDDALVIDGQDGSLFYSSNGAEVVDGFGWSIDNAGDLDGGGRDDVIVGAHYGDNNSGDAWIFSRESGKLIHTFDGDADGSYAAGDRFGVSVSGAGDVNGDGYHDVIIGASGDDENGLTDSGSARVYSGADFTTVLHTFTGDAAGDEFGSSVSGAGDVNGDGYDDVVVGAPGDDDNGVDAGSARIFSGQDGSVLYTFHGDSAGDGFGISVSGAGDVNGDGRDDVIVGAHQGNNGTGSARVFALDAHMIPSSISNVTIPDTPMAVGDTVTVTLTVDDDGGNAYTSIQGTIGGFAVSGLNRTDSTTYTAQFTVTADGAELAAGDDIPVNLAIVDSTGATSASYSTAIGQANDSIDTVPVTFTGAAYDEGNNILTLTGTNMNTLLGVGEDETTPIQDRLDWSKLAWDTDGDGGISATFGIVPDGGIASALVTDDTTLTITADAAVVATNPAVALALATLTLDPGQVVISEGFAVDAAGNVATTDGYRGPADTSTVIFDLRDGESSGHSGRTFSDAIDYNIYIVVEPASASVIAPPAWSMPDGFLFSVNDTIHLVADGTIQGYLGSNVNGALYGTFLNIPGAAWRTPGIPDQAGAAAGLTAHGNLLRAYGDSNGNDYNIADLLWSGAAGGLNNARLLYSNALPASNILSSQGIS